MTELLEGGPPGRQRRWPTVLAVVLLVAVLGAGAVQKLSGGGTTVAGRTPTPTVSRPSYLPPSFGPPSLPAATTAPVESAPPVESTPPVPSDLLPPTLHPRLVGVPLRNPSSVNLLVGGSQLIRVGSRTAGLGDVPVSAGNRVVGVQAIPAGLLVTVTIGTGQTQPYLHVFLVRKGAPARLLTATDSAFPAADGQSIFGTHFASADTDANVVTRIDLVGHVLSRHNMPATSVLSGDTVKGLLAARLGNDTQSSTLQLLDRSTFKVTRTLGRIGWVVPGSGSTRVAWTDSPCETTCNLVTTDLSTGRQRVVPIEAGFYASYATISPDGNRVAIAYYGRHPEQVGGAAAGFVDVVDLLTGARHRVPGVATDIKQAADLSWTPDGRFLAIAVGITDQNYRVVGLWPAAGGAVQIVLPRVPGGYDGGGLLAL